MSQLDQNEIIIKLATILNKQAANPEGWVPEAVSTTGEGSGLAKELEGGAEWEVGAQVAKKVLPWAAGALAGGWGGLVAVLSNPITLAALGLAAFGGIAYALYKEYHYKDSIDEAIENMKTLDPNHKIKNVIDTWTRQLQQYSEALVLPTPTDDPKQAASNNKIHLTSLNGAYKLINTMINAWPSTIEPNLEDLGTDSQDTYKALNKASAEIKNAIDKAAQEGSKFANERIKELSKTKKTDYSKIAQNVVDNYNTIKNTLHEEPELTPVEQKALELAQSMINNTVDQDNFNNYYKNMVNLNKSMINIIKQLKTRKVSSFNISKRAIRVKLPNGSYLGEDSSKPKEKTNPLVSEAQDMLNDIGVAAHMNFPRLKVDGVWNKETADVLAKLVSLENFDKYFAKFGISKEVVLQSDFPQSKYLGKTVNILSSFLNYLQAGQENNNIEDNQKKKQTSLSNCQLDKINPTSEEILSCLKNRAAIDPATKEYVNLYEFGVRMGYNEDQMVRYIYDHFKGSSSRDWDTQAILKDWEGRGRRSLF